MIDEKTEAGVPMEQTPITPNNPKKEPKQDQPEVILAGVAILGAVVAGSVYKKHQVNKAFNPPIEQPSEMKLEIGKPFQMKDEWTGIPLDLNQDKTIDGLIILNASGQIQDPKESKVVEIVLVDTDEDGKEDTILLDLDEDGTWAEARLLSTADEPRVAVEIEWEDAQNPEVVVVCEHVVLPDCLAETGLEGEIELHPIEVETLADLDLQTDDESAYEDLMEDLELSS